MISHPVENDVVLFDVRIAHPVAINALHTSLIMQLEQYKLGTMRSIISTKGIMTYWMGR